VGVKEGDQVQAYQAIASIDVRELQKNLEKHSGIIVKNAMILKRIKEQPIKTL